VVAAEGVLREFVGLRPDLLERDDVTAAGAQPVAEPPALRGADPVDVGGGDAEHAGEVTVEP
jgi:hypothetical protein